MTLRQRIRGRGPSTVARTPIINGPRRLASRSKCIPWPCVVVAVLLVLAINFWYNADNAKLFYETSHNLLDVHLKNLYSKTKDSQFNKHQQQSEQYLYFTSHSGFSNQLIGLYRAAQLAYSTNRTLILPPLLSHHTANEAGNARGLGAKRGVRCGPDHLDWVKLDAQECNKTAHETSHVKFSELINMAKLPRTLNVPFVDLCEFVEKEG